MSHYQITRWADYVRGLGETGDLARMGSHLEDGCERCTSMVGALRRVAATAAADSAMTPAAGAVRSVRALFATQNPQATHWWSDLSLRRVFDSALAPAPESRRAPHVADRQLLFESDEYTLELSVDHCTESEKAVVRGQLLEARGEPRSHTPVFLVGGGEVLGRTISDDLGTFEITSRLDRPCEIWVFPDGDHRIKLRLAPEN